MAINWDEIRKKAQAKGMQAESQVNFTRATPSLPRANTLPKATVTPINPSTFRNAPALTKITPEQQAKNQALAVEELSGNQGNIASFARGAALATLDPFGIRKLTPQGSNVAQEQASAKNMYNIPVIKNPRAVSQGLKPVETGNIKGTYEGLGEFAGSMVGVDPVGIGLTKGVQKGLQIANKQAAKIPVLVNGKTVFVDAATQGVSKNVSAPLPRVLPRVSAEKALQVETPLNITRTIPQETIPRATELTAQPILPQKGAEIPTEIKTPETAQKPIGKVEQKLKDLGADTNIYDKGQKVSRVKSNTFQNSEIFNAAEKEMLSDKDYKYDVVSEQQSLAQAKQRLEADFDGEVSDLQQKSNFDGVDADTSMGILESYIKEARETGDYSKVNNWTELIQDKGTQGGQLLQSFAKYSRTPEGALIKAKQTVAKVERDIEQANPNLIEKVKRETKQTTDAIKKAQDETAETLGELIARYTQDSANKLSTKISIPGKPKTSAPLQQAFDDLTKELYKIAKETLPTVKTTKKEIDATSILKTAIENKQNYQDVWENAKYLLQRKYANNPEAMVMLNDFFNKEVIPSFSKKTLDTAINQSAKDFGVDLGKIIKSSQGDKSKLAKDIQNYVLYKIGVTGEDAKALSDELLTQYNAILKTKTESALKQMFPEAFGKQLPTKADKKTLGQKVIELINMGAYDNQAIKNIIKEKNNVPVLENSEIKTIVENMELAAKETDPYMKNMYASRAEQIISDKTPAEFREKFRALQRLSMILNPKTLLTRNPLGNTLLGLAENVKDIPGAAIDKAISLKTGERTTALAPIEKGKAQIQGFAQGLDEWRKDIKYGVDTSPSRGQFELPSGRVFKGELLNSLDQFERKTLQLGDRPHYQSAYNSRIAELKKLGKVGEEAEVDAKLYALDRVFQNDSELSKRAVQIRKSLGLPGDLLMPFTQTPANILDKLIDYSPAGLGKAVYQLGTTAGKGTFNQKKFVDTLARSFTGGGIVALTYAMMDKGILKGSLSSNQDVRQAQQLQGEQAYSIKIGDKWYSYDWAQPIAGMMAATADAIKAGAEKDDIAEAISAGGTSAIDSVFNQSFLSGILSAFSGYSPASGIGQALLGSTSQVTPTVGASLARTIDPTMRETYDPNTLKQQGNKLIARLPFASKTLLPKVDVKGQPILQSQGRGLGARAFENFLAPFKISKEVDDKVNAELMRIQAETGDNAVLLNKTPKNLEKNNEKYIFTTKEYTQYQTTAGQKSYSDINAFIKTPEYKDMTDSERADAIKKIHANALESAQVEMFKNRKLPVTLALDKSYQEKYDVVKSVISDQKFYDTIKAMQSGGDSDIQKAYAIQSKVKDVPMEVYDELGISEESYATANLLKSVGVKPENIENVYLATKDIESDKYINSNGNESAVSAGSNLEKRGEGQSASLKKKLAIDQANPNASRAQLMALYNAFDVSEKVW